MAIKLTREIVNSTDDASFVLTHYVNPYFEAPFHFHPEYELILIEEGEGVRYVGDSVGRMVPGDFMLIGPNLPHLWLSDDRYYMAGCEENSHSVYAQFSSSLLPENLSSIPELRGICNLLHESRRGLIFTGENLDRLSQEFRDAAECRGFRRWSSLLALLDNLGRDAGYRYLTSSKYDVTANTWEDKVVERINQYVAVNYCRDITLDELCGLVHMNKSSLCRYYRRVTGRRIFDYLAQTRIDFALKLLRNSSYSVSRIALECGYNTPSHFYHQFKGITGLSPTEYVENVLRSGRRL